MRTTLLLFTISFFLVQKSNAQFLEVGDKWIYDTREFRLLGIPSYSEKIDSIEITKDTLINGLQYFKLIASQRSPCGVFYSTEYLREEGDQIYRLTRDFSNDNLMIDFSIQDSYDVTYIFPQIIYETTVINDSIGIEILPNGQPIEFIYQRIINNTSFDDDTQYKLSREIGYLEPRGLLFPNIGTGRCDIRIFLNLRCKISENDTIKVTNLDCYQSSITSSTSELEENASNFIFPNPTNGMINIDEGFIITSIYEITGRKVNFTQSQNTVDMSNFDSGIYIINVQNKNDRSTIRNFKLIKL